MSSKPIVSVPQFFSIQSTAFPGYNVTQRGNQLVLAPSNLDNPFQLWIKDASWNFIHRDAFVFINHGSKKVLDSGNMRPGTKVKLGDYDPNTAEERFVWRHVKDNIVTNFLPDLYMVPGLWWSREDSLADESPIVLSEKLPEGEVLDEAIWKSWKLVPYVPKEYRLGCYWVNQHLRYKTPNEEVRFPSMPRSATDELNVVGVAYNNAVEESMVWLKVPAGGEEDTTDFTSFVVINRSTGLALKGTTKPGDKVYASPYDPLDYDFVWSEDRRFSTVSSFVHINLARAAGLDQFWTLPADNEYQNMAWYHPLTLQKQSAGANARQLWQFTPLIT